MGGMKFITRVSAITLAAFVIAILLFLESKTPEGIFGNSFDLIVYPTSALLAAWLAYAIEFGLSPHDTVLKSSARYDQVGPMKTQS